MVDSPLTWTWQQALLFPTLFVVPAEILALVVDGMIAHYSKEPGLPSPANLVRRLDLLCFVKLNTLLVSFKTLCAFSTLKHTSVQRNPPPPTHANRTSSLSETYHSPVGSRSLLYLVQSSPFVTFCKLAEHHRYLEQVCPSVRAHLCVHVKGASVRAHVCVRVKGARVCVGVCVLVRMRA